ncbi:MAG TPA: tRNA (adenosine(37)-N6)-threonylcarbamoyltransferase complex dimerization subunit type 1 TsaB [Dongiaceae bacterium]|nr:tRNA (adenosine(37)-N6)-threonylcarbamoyltransferase complex dimerization subunit type 1 TsaB [Dongiaceae bacterium]
MDRPVLGIDTASRRGSLAIAGAGDGSAEELIEGGRHAGGLLPAIEAVLARSGLLARDLTGIGIVSGPGSFTGLKVGLATAKGLGYALDIPVEGLSTLEAIAAAVAGLVESGPLCTLIEAGRGEVYAARFAIEAGAARRLDPDAAWKPEALRAALAPGTLLAGDAAPRLLAGEAVRFREIAIPALAPIVAAWARAVIPPGARYRPGGPTPNYVRPSDPEAARRPL